MCLNENIDPKNAHGKQVLIPIKYLKDKSYDVVTRKKIGWFSVKPEDFKEHAISQGQILKDYIYETYKLSLYIDSDFNSKTLLINIK